MKTKKTLPVVLLAICLQCVLFLFPNKAYAAGMTPVTPNETFYGTLETGDAEHYYSFTVDKTGYFSIDFSLMDFAADVKDGWKIELCYADTGNSFYSTYLELNTTLPVFNFKQGTKLYIAVSARSGWNETLVPIGQTYAINIKTVEDMSWEQESNNDGAAFTLVEAEKTYHGNLYYGEDVDYYEYTVGHDGYFNVNFSLKDITADVKDGWKVELCYGDTATSFYSTYLESNTTLPVFNFKQGTKLYIVVSANSGWNETLVPLWQEYMINIKITEDTSWEQEKNDTSSNAMLITGDKTYHGNLYYGEDVDYYEYTVNHNGYFNIGFSLADITADVKDGWKVELYNGADGTSIYSTYLETNTTLPDFNLKQGTKLYIAVSAHSGWNETLVPLWQEYMINIKTTKDADWEKETLIGAGEAWSNRSQNATTVSLGKKYYGNMCMENDNDLYKFSIDKTGYATITFDPDDVESNTGYGYSVNILTKSGKVASENRLEAVGNIKVYLKKGTYYIEVSRASTDSPILKRYIVSVSHKAETPAKVSSIKKKGTKISWKKVSNADGYEISYSTKSNFKKQAKAVIDRTDTFFYELYGLKSKKTYYVRVRSYKTTGTGAKVYGAWSSIVKVRA